MILDRVFPVVAITTGTIVFYLELLALVQRLAWLRSITSTVARTVRP